MDEQTQRSKTHNDTMDHGGMGQRGVTRMQMKHDADSDDHGAGEHEQMDRAHKRRMLVQHHKQTQWVYWTVILLGFWLMTSAVTFGYGSGVVDVAGDRWLPFDLETRINAMVWSDLISGALLVILGWLSLDPHKPKALWGACLVGVWLNLAPLLFWSPTAWGYVNDTLVGSLVVALTVLIPGMPWMIMMMKRGPQIPKGWSYNPSSWPQRWIMIATGVAGWFVSRYLAAYQMGYIDQIWEPFFGSGSVEVLTSRVSEMWPVSDGGLGAFSYTFEALMGFMGSPARWRTMPWMVTFFGILVIPLGLTHIALVISQPVLVGHWCTMCLLAAAIMLPMIPLEIDEVAAMVQFMLQSKREGKPFWHTFWRGGTVEGEGMDERSPELSYETLTNKSGTVFGSMVWGVSVPWTLALSALLGIWLMAQPDLLGSAKPMADSLHLVGSLIVVVSVISMGEIVRAGRYLNVPAGLWIAASPFILGGATGIGAWIAVAVGLAVAALSIPRGPVKERYGIWQKYVV